MAIKGRGVNSRREVDCYHLRMWESEELHHGEQQRHAVLQI